MTKQIKITIVTVSGKTAGVIREQDLFFEMERITNQ